MKGYIQISKQTTPDTILKNCSNAEVVFSVQPDTHTAREEKELSLMS